MNPTLKRFIFMCALALAVLVPSSLQAERLHPGLYLLKCKGSTVQVYDIIGNHIGYLVGYTCFGNWVIRVRVEIRAPEPEPPQYDQPQHPAWMGMSAMQWVTTIRDGYQLSPGDPLTAADLNDIELNPPPTLTCNEAHFDPPVLD